MEPDTNLDQYLEKYIKREIIYKKKSSRTYSHRSHHYNIMHRTERIRLRKNPNQTVPGASQRLRSSSEAHTALRVAWVSHPPPVSSGHEERLSLTLPFHHHRSHPCPRTYGCELVRCPDLYQSVTPLNGFYGPIRPTARRTGEGSRHKEINIYMRLVRF